MDAIINASALTIFVSGAVLAFISTAIIQRNISPTMGLEPKEPFYSSYWFNLSVVAPFLFAFTSLLYNLDISGEQIGNWHELVEFIVNENYKTSLGFLSLALILSVTVARFHHSKQQSETLASHQKNTIYANAFQHRKEFSEMLEKEFSSGMQGERLSPRSAHTAFYPRAFEGKFYSHETFAFIDDLIEINKATGELVYKDSPTDAQWRLLIAKFEGRFSLLNKEFLRVGFTGGSLTTNNNSKTEDSYLSHERMIDNTDRIIRNLEKIYSEASDFLPTLDKKYTSALEDAVRNLAYLRDHTDYIKTVSMHLEYKRKDGVFERHDNPNIRGYEKYVYPLYLEQSFDELVKQNARSGT